jgi:hypothetical protein
MTALVLFLDLLLTDTNVRLRLDRISRRSARVA